jgi:hypothetical protein
MELCEFRERIYGKYKSRLFVFESAWGSFRPIDGVGWDGRVLREVDEAYKQDIFSSAYGYGTENMKTVCDHLTRHVELEERVPISDSFQFWKWCGAQDAVWWRDRPCVFTSKCVGRTPEDWKRYVRHLHSKPQTLRQHLTRRLTKRVKGLVPK